MKKIAIITVHNTTKYDLEKTLKSIDSQSRKPDLSLVIAKQVKGLNVNKFKKNYRSFIIGKDKSLWNAMNIGIKFTKEYFILYLNSGDKFYDKNSILHIQRNIRFKFITYIFKTELVFEKISFIPKKQYFLNKNYSPHPSFIRSPINSNRLNLFNEKNLINSDGEWMKHEREKKVVKKIDKIITTHYLGGRSTNPTLSSIKILLSDSIYSGIKEIIKFIIHIILKKKYYYKLIYFFRYETRKTK